MAKRLLVVLLALFIGPVTAGAQAQFPKPADVPDYVTVNPGYAAGTADNVEGDGTTTAGTPPGYSAELAEVNPVTESGWTTTTGTQCITGSSSGCAEAKFRTTISGQVIILSDDPIRNYGRPGTSHCHTFFGNLSANAYSTYASLRKNARAKSLAAGGPANGTAYWFPCVEKLNPFGNGKNYVVKPSGSIIVYYSDGVSTIPRIKRLLLGLRYVGGYNMDAGGTDAAHSTKMQNLVDAANAQPGTSGRYSVCNIGDCHTYAKWTCAGASPGSSTVLKNANGTDPFNGTCVAGADLWMQFLGPNCWDGRNLWSPGGYDHVVPEIYDDLKNKFVCPNGWYRIPALQLQIHFTHSGFSDYGNWVLSSDVAAGKTSTPGITFHTDWFNGWDRTILSHWLTNCIGIEGGTSRQCDGSSTSVEQLITGTAPTGRSPQVQSGTGGTGSAGQMFLLPDQSNGPKTLHIHG